MDDHETVDEAIRRYRKQGWSDDDLVQAQKKAEALARSVGDHQAAQQFALQRKHIESKRSSSSASAGGILGCLLIMIGIGLLVGALWYFNLLPIP